MTSTDIDLEIYEAMEADFTIRQLEKRLQTRFIVGFASGWFAFWAAAMLLNFLLN